MLKADPNPKAAADKVVKSLMNYEGTTEHGQHFLIDTVRGFGINANPLEDDQELQGAVLATHHAFVASFSRTSAIKIIENAHGGNWTVAA